jgi:hypothetical protein
MLKYSATILKFADQGEKTGWQYVPITHRQAQLLQPEVKKSYRVKGTLDSYPIQQLAIIPMGDGSFILPLNTTIRRGLKKATGQKIQVAIEVDGSPLMPSFDLIDCLSDEPAALDFFESLTPSHQQYFSKLVESAKTETTKAKRIAMSMRALAQRKPYNIMIRESKGQ